MSTGRHNIASVGGIIIIGCELASYADVLMARHTLLPNERKDCVTGPNSVWVAV